MGNEDVNKPGDIILAEYKLVVFSGKLEAVTGSMHVSYKTICVKDGNLEKKIQVFIAQETGTAFITDFYYDKYKTQIDSLFGGKVGKTISDTNEEFDSIIDDIAENGIQINQLRILEQNRSYIDLLQNEICEAVEKEPINNKSMALYLNYAESINSKLLSLYDIFDVYWILKNSMYGHNGIKAVNENVRICLSILNKEPLNNKEWDYISSIMKEVNDNCVYYELLYSLSYMNLAFVENVFAEIYEHNKTETIADYLYKLHSETVFEDMLDRVRNTKDKLKRNRTAIELLRYYPNKRSILVNEITKFNDDSLLFAMEEAADQEDIHDVAKIVKKEIARKKNLNNYKPIICPNDGYKIKCLRTTKLRYKRGGIFIIPIYECAICNRRYTVSENWYDYEPIKVRTGFIINLLTDPLKVSSNRPLVTINPHLEKKILSKKAHEGNDAEYGKKRCIVFGKNTKANTCRTCDAELVSGTCILPTNKGKGIVIKMCPLCGIIHINYKYYEGNEGIFECDNKEELRKIQLEYAYKAEKQRIEKNKTAVEKPKVSVKTNVINEIKTEHSNANKSVVKPNKNVKEKQKRKVPDINTIQVKDFVVRRNVFQCMHKDHSLVNVNASMNLINKDGNIINTTVSAGYCKDCNTYFIMESTFQKLKSRGTPICRISDEKAYLKGYSSVNGMKLANESLLMQYGYNVSQQEGLTTARRHKILAILIDNSNMTKSEIISYLDFFINQRQYQHKYEKAIEKWNIDKDFVDEYRAGRYTTIGVSGIYLR